VDTSAATSAYGQSVTFTATISLTADAGVAPTGKVTFKDGTTNLGNGTLSLVGGVYVATFSTSKLAVGSHSITAVYDGDSNYDSSTSSAITEAIETADTTTVLSLAKDPIVVGQTVKLTANVSSAGDTPAGTVTFMSGTTVLGIVNLTGAGQAVLNVSSLLVGDDSLTAVYTPADDSFAMSSSSAVDETVEQASTRINLASNATPAAFGFMVTFTATITVINPGGGLPTGSVAFYDGSTLLGTGTLSAVDGKSIATFSDGNLSVGVHSITAVYSGDANYAASASGNLNQRILTIPTTTSAISGGGSATSGQPVTFTATITLSADAGVPPTGKVNFKDGTKLLGSGTISLVNGQYVATFTSSKLDVGSHSITAIYVGDDNYQSSTSAAIDEEIS
jgi:hypothetical protein